MATTNRPPQKRARPPITLYIVRSLPMPREQLFNAWTVPTELRRWFGPEEGYTLETIEIDAKKGGSYRLGMKPYREDTYYVGGRYLDVRPGQLLAFTWHWETPRTWSREPTKVQEQPTMVSVQFKDLDDGRATELFLQHEGFQDDKDREDHRWGWTGCLTRLGNSL